MQYLYKDEHYNFMDNETFEQVAIPEEHIGEKQVPDGKS